jgi:hypothetical protein
MTFVRESDMADDPYNELGRRLLAAVISYRMGYAVVDRTLKTIPETVHSSWAQLGQDLDRAMAESVGQAIAPPIKKLTDEIQ